MICDHAHKCGRHDCDHAREHQKNSQCDLACGFYGTTKCRGETPFEEPT